MIDLETTRAGRLVAHRQNLGSRFRGPEHLPQAISAVEGKRIFTLGLCQQLGSGWSKTDTQRVHPQSLALRQEVGQPAEVQRNQNALLTARCASVADRAGVLIHYSRWRHRREFVAGLLDVAVLRSGNRSLPGGLSLVKLDHE